MKFAQSKYQAMIYLLYLEVLIKLLSYGTCKTNIVICKFLNLIIMYGRWRYQAVRGSLLLERVPVEVKGESLK